YQCGPAALAMVLRYYGADADEAAIGRALYLPSARGTLNLELELYARRQGFRARSFAGTLEWAKTELARDRPLVIFQDLGTARPPAPPLPRPSGVRRWGGDGLPPPGGPGVRGPVLPRVRAAGARAGRGAAPPPPPGDEVTPPRRRPSPRRRAPPRRPGSAPAG